MHPQTLSRSKAAFTLAEILLAMMVFAIAISTILALLARSIETVDSILVKDEAIGLSSAVDSYMAELDFADAYDLVNTDSYLYTYQYRAHPSNLSSDGTLAPYPVIGTTDELGEDYVVVAAVRQPGDTNLDADLVAREGRLFQVHLSVSENNPFGTTLPADPDAGSGTTGFPDYDSAVLVIFAEFYQVPAKLSGKVDTTNLSPAFSFNFAVRR